MTHGLQYTRLPCLSLSPRVCSNSCPLSQWFHPTISSSVTPFSTCPQSFLASESFPILHHGPEYWSFSFCISPSNEYSELISFRIDWFDLLAVQGTLKSSPAPQFESINFSVLSLLYGPTLTSTHDYWKNHNFDYMDFCRQCDVLAYTTTHCFMSSLICEKSLVFTLVCLLVFIFFWSIVDL